MKNRWKLALISFVCLLLCWGGVPLSSFADSNGVAPIITVQPQDQTARVGQTVTFSVQAAGQNVKYQWFELKSLYIYRIDSSTSKTSNFSFEVKAADDGKKFLCAAYVGDIQWKEMYTYEYDGVSDYDEMWSFPLNNYLVDESSIARLIIEPDDNQISVNFDYQGGDLADSPDISFLYRKTVTKRQPYGELPDPVWPCYWYDYNDDYIEFEFLGWWTAKYGGKQVIASTICNAASSYTLYAHWSGAYIYFHENGGDWLDDDVRICVPGEPYGEMPIPSRNGYVFAGWYTSGDGGKIVKEDTICYGSGCMSLYAHWMPIPKTYTVTLNPNGGTCGTASKQVTYGKAYGTMPVPTRKGYTFAGWWTAKDAGGKKVTASTICYATGNYTLYARWTEGYTMTFNPNGGTVSPTTKVVKYGQQYGSLPTPTRAGYTFAGWWTTKADGGKKVVSTTVCYASAGYTLYARWTAKKFVVTLNPNGGECATATKTVTYGQAYGTMLVPSPRTGYTFAGWYTAKTGGKKVTASTVCYASGNYTLYARWTPKTYTVTLNPNGGSCTAASKKVTYGQTYGTLPVPTRSGYAFAGWWTAKDTGGKQVFSSTTCYATGNYTLYARWTKGTN